MPRRASIRCLALAAGLTGAIAGARGGEIIEVNRCAIPSVEAYTDQPAVALKECNALIRSRRYSGGPLASLYQQRGEIHLAMRNGNAAIADFTQAIALQPSMVEAWRARGDARLLVHDNEGAIADYSHAIALAPKDSLLLYGRAQIFRENRNYAQAIADFTAAIALDPGQVQFRTERALAYEGADDFESALADYTAAAQLDGKNFGAVARVCYLTLFLHAPAQAVERCTTAITLNDKSPMAWETRGLAYVKLGRLNEALSDFEAALALDPHEPVALYGRGITKLKGGDAAGGNADIAEAKARAAHVAEDLARAGISP